ncbi:MAG: penicillin-binding protein 2 [Betaproteobacteria bacterium]
MVILFFAGFISLAARALYCQSINKEFLQSQAEQRSDRRLELIASRGVIKDRNSQPLAISTSVDSVYAVPSKIDLDQLSEEKINALTEILKVSKKTLKQKLSQHNRDFVYLKRQMPPNQAKKAVNLGIDGISLETEYKRYYPEAEIFAQLIGYTSLDHKGQEGLERAFQESLSGKSGSRSVVRDNKGRIVEQTELIREVENGEDVILSIDKRLQFLAYRELQQAAIEHKAKSASVVVLNAQTGEVLALANYPSFNPNNRATFDFSRTRNKAIVDVYEPGSTLKPITIAAALDSHAVKEDSVIDIESGFMRIGRRTISDSHPDESLLTVSQIIKKSSNVGSAKIALSMEPEKFWNVLSGVGFGAPPESQFPGEASGVLRNFVSWKPIEQATMSYGHGVSVSLLQLARAYTIFANDGEVAPISFIKVDGTPTRGRVISEQTAQTVLKMLETVTEEGGTGTRARIAGYRVAGKTGTAHKLVGGKYSANQYVSSFVGLAPVSDPSVIVAVMIDEPSAGKYYGSEVAAPVFKNVMEGALRILKIPGDSKVLQEAKSSQDRGNG